jgi:cytoskeleton protein RodZ
MTSVGEKLHCERIRQGIGLVALASDLKINPKYLEAIEAGSAADLPGAFFYRSFVRQYAAALGMDAGVFGSELDQVRDPEPVLVAAVPPADRFPLKTPDPIVMATNQRIATGHIAGYVMLLICVLIGCSGFYAWWHRIEFSGRTVAAAAPVINPPSETSQPVPAPPAVSPAVEAQPVALEAEPAAVSPPTVAAIASDKVVLNVAVREKTWLSITSDDKPVFSGVLEPSQTKTLGGRERARIRVGNAAGLEITWNGKAIGPIGPRGQVRTVLFTPENFQILPVGGSL